MFKLTSISALSAVTLLHTTLAWSQTSSVELEEIVVTAQKITQDVQKVPLAIEVLTADELEAKGISSLYALDREAAGLHIFDLGPSVNILIRGVGNQSALASSDPTAAFNVDGVYRSRATSLNGVMFDLARVEVVKGPMGTLYGRNATTGAVNVLTNAPSREDEASGTLEVGNYSELRGQAMINAPLSDNTAFRAAFGLLRHKGYQTDGYDDADQVGGRAKWLYKPSEQTSLLVTGDFQRQGGSGQGNAIQDPAAIGAAPNPLFLRPAGANAWYGNEAPGNLSNQDWGLTAEVNHDLGWANLFVQPAYRAAKSVNRGYTSGTRFGVVNDFNEDQKTFEARLSAPNESSLKWVGGLYYYKENLHLFTGQPFVPPTVAPYVTTIPGTTLVPNRARGYAVSDLGTESYAAFGQLIIPIVDSFRLIAGGRYTRDKRTLSGDFYIGEYDVASPDIVYVLPGLATHVDSPNATFSRTDWKGGFEFDVAKDSMLYASASTGFKAGGLNLVNTSSAPLGAGVKPTYDPEELMEYTVGIKNRLFDNRMTLNVAYFHWDYKNRQALNFGNGSGAIVSNPNSIASPVCPTDNNGNNASNPNATSVTCSAVNMNFGKQVFQGVDLDGQLAITADDRLGWSFAWLDAKYANDPLNAGTLVASGDGTNPTQGFIDLRNKRVAQAPEWSGNLDFSHDFHFSGDKVLSLMLNASYASAQDVNGNLGLTAFNFVPASRAAADAIGHQASLQKAYWLGDFSLAYKPTDKFTTTLWVRNVTNETVKASAATAIGATPTVWLSTVRPPRTYGVSFSVKL